MEFETNTDQNNQNDDVPQVAQTRSLTIAPLSDNIVPEQKSEQTETPEESIGILPNASNDTEATTPDDMSSADDLDVEKPSRSAGHTIAMLLAASMMSLIAGGAAFIISTIVN